MHHIAHYAVCLDCVRKIRRQGWSVGYRENDGAVTEVFFIYKGCTRRSSECVRE